MNLKFKECLSPLFKSYKNLSTIIEKIHHEGGTCYVVGGTVRDCVVKRPIKDLDIEVHGLAIEQLQQILQYFGFVDLVGKSFGVLRLKGLDIDWSLPRKDQSGRKPQVTINPSMDVRHAFERRDLTMNAMGINLKTFELVDPFGGLQDIEDKILRVPNAELFVEDPLRFYRILQFISRFEMQPDTALNELCASMDISAVSAERIEQELKKWLLLSKKPSLSLRWLDQIGRLKEIFPEIYATKGIPQEFEWHPEGDVFEHLCQTVDAAAAQTYENDEQKLICLYAAMLHDIGKTTTTQLLKGRLRSFNHEHVGARLAHTFMKRITRDHSLIKSVVKLIDAHMYPPLFIKQNAGPAAYKRLAQKLFPEVTLALLTQVSLADRQGRNPQPDMPLEPQPMLDVFKTKAEQLGVLYGPTQPLLQGRDLMPEIQPGPELGAILKKAYKLQIEKNITDKEELKKRILKK